MTSNQFKFKANSKENYISEAKTLVYKSIYGIKHSGAVAEGCRFRLMESIVSL